MLLFTKLIKSYGLVERLIMNSEQLLSGNFLQSSFYEKFREIRREVKNDPALFEQKREEARIFYLSIYPMLAHRNQAFTKEWFTEQVKDIKTLTKALDLIALLSSKENQQLGRELELAQALKNVLVQSDVPPRDRIEGLKNLMNSEIDKEINSFPKSETPTFFQQIIEAIKGLFQPKTAKEAIGFSKSSLQQILWEDQSDTQRDNNSHFGL